MRIQELARQTGVSIRSLRYYEQKQLIASRRLHNGYRDFNETAIERVRTIQMYFGLGLTTDQIEQIINCQGTHVIPQKHPLCEEVLTLYQEKLQEIEEQINTLDAVRSRLQERIAHFQQLKTQGSLQREASRSPHAQAGRPGESADELHMLQADHHM
jgi:DNA-binding transcriptional MerR regulator